ncbi:lysophospholipid acyltransferase family protein [Methylomicrobium album]|uniref:1-acyl-sn-glycerol-3-phosphate acyltransferase n=1 Tax=Methylomicrobium album BG8 TaxID=686340 RepID=H8GP67_METAL|nr:1-acyl-sn-glycerol-3-phosphate acyltransferase [Methylomicrobium album]EIC29653.1 1-acyl-sn-glycerol-3-phosphate acyltransferase [Methylomicrobium album BG8]
MKAKLRLYSKAAGLMLLFTAGFLIAAGLFPVIGLVRPPAGARQIRDAVKLRWLQRFGRILNLRVDRSGSLARHPVLVVSNHVSWLDIIVLGGHVPGCFAAKDDIAGWPVIGYLSRQAGTVFIRRGDRKQILQTTEKMAWQLRRNGNMLVFPEGTTTDGNEVLDFHASLFQPALLTHAAIQPAAIRYLNAAGKSAPFVGDETFVAHLFKMLALEKIDVKLDFLPAIESEDKTRNGISREARSLIREALRADEPVGVLTPASRKIRRQIDGLAASLQES